MKSHYHDQPRNNNRTSRRVAAASLVALLAVSGACSSDEKQSSNTNTAPATVGLPSANSAPLTTAPRTMPSSLPNRTTTTSIQESNASELERKISSAEVTAAVAGFNSTIDIINPAHRPELQYQSTLNPDGTFTESFSKTVETVSQNQADITVTIVHASQPLDGFPVETVGFSITGTPPNQYEISTAHEPEFMTFSLSRDGNGDWTGIETSHSYNGQFQRTISTSYAETDEDRFTEGNLQGTTRIVYNTLAYFIPLDPTEAAPGTTAAATEQNTIQPEEVQTTAVA